MTEPVIWNVHDNVVLTTYGKQPCPHCYDRREFAGRVYWTMPRAITCGLAGISVAICATCVAEGEAQPIRQLTETMVEFTDGMVGYAEKGEPPDGSICSD